MIVHILLIRPREDLSAEEQQELEEALASLRTVLGVQRFTWGPDFSGRGKGYTYGAVMHFADRPALNAYGGNEAHLRVVSVLQRLTADRLVVDYEVDSSGIST